MTFHRQEKKTFLSLKPKNDPIADEKKLILEAEINITLPIVPYKLYVVPLVALLNAVHTDGVPICCVAGVTSGDRDSFKCSESKSNI